jgi:hypothetical protein
VVAQLGFALLAASGPGGSSGEGDGSRGAAASRLRRRAGSFHPHFTSFQTSGSLPARVPPAYRWLALHGEGRALMEFPRGGPKFWAHRMYLSTYHWLPVVDGYAGYWPRTPEFLYAIARALPSHGALQELVDHVDVGWILVHRRRIPRLGAQGVGGELSAGLERAGEWAPDLLLRDAAAEERSPRLAAGRAETLGSVPLAPLASVPGSPAVARPPPEPWPPRGSATIPVRVRNASDVPWPAFGFLPRHLVRLVAVLHPAGEPPGPAQEVPLPQDVPPHAEVTVSVQLTAPLRSGDYVLELGLLQVGDGPLARCGVAPLNVPVRVGVAAATQRSP